MGYDSINIRRNWETCPREATNARWQALYATMNPGGDIVISRFTHKALGDPDSYVLLFDRENWCIGLQPARSQVDKNAYPARLRGRHGGRRIRGYRLCREFGIRVEETVRFHRAAMDNRGVLILDLNETRSAGQRRKGKRQK
jgi:hypothetical protein